MATSLPSSTFTYADLRKGFELTKCLSGIPIAESKLTPKELQEKYFELKNLQEYLQSFDQKVLKKQEEKKKDKEDQKKWS